MSDFNHSRGAVSHFCLYSLNDDLEFESKAAGTQYAAGDGPRAALEVLVNGDAWIIYRNTKTGVLHWDFVSISDTAILSCTDDWERALRVVSSVSQWRISSKKTIGLNFTFTLKHRRATGSIGLNITELIELGTLWGSDTLTNVGNSLNELGNDANVGNILGNKMFYTNDYMVSDRNLPYRHSGFLT